MQRREKRKQTLQWAERSFTGQLKETSSQTAFWWNQLCNILWIIPVKALG
jgi:hypothetical protein